MKFEIVFECTVTGQPHEGENGLIYSCGCSGIFSGQCLPRIGEIMLIMSKRGLLLYRTDTEDFKASKQRVLSIEHLLDSPKRVFSARLRLSPLNITLVESSASQISRFGQIMAVIEHMESKVFEELRERGFNGGFYVLRRP